jgi:hypothetical protein
METQRGHYNPRAWDRPWILQRQRLDDLVTIVLSVLSIEAASVGGLFHFRRDARYWPKADTSLCTAHVRFRGRYWGQSGHDLLRRICPLLTQSGPQADTHFKKRRPPHVGL